ncbi:MAG: ATP-binding protein [Sandaracinaceae bacterium]
MKVSRFEVRILAAILAVVGVTLGAALWFGQGALAEAYGVGVNERVLDQLRETLDVYRRLFVVLRDDADRTADAIANDYRGRQAFEGEDVDARQRFLSETLDRYEHVGRIEVTVDGTTVASLEREERLDRDTQRLLTLRRPFVSGGEMQITVATDAGPFHDFQRAGELVEVYARLVGGAEYVSGFYVGVYIAFVLAVLVIALAVGIIVSRRVTRRVAVLAEATERVGRGDLSVSVPSDGRDEVAELTRAFNAMVRDIRESRDRIEYLQRIGAWQDFARRLAHEIKNPLTPIQLAVQQVHKTYSGEDERYRRQLDDAASIVDEEVETLRRLVSEFSEFARLPVAALEPADLRVFVREATVGLDAAALLPSSLSDATPPSLQIDTDGPSMPVRIDAQMLRRVLDNLTRNAVQAVAASQPVGGGRVIIATSLDGDWAQLEVRDDGPGIAPGSRAKVFDPYFTTKEEGTGLGLAIVKKVVLEHAGSIDCAEAPEGGAVFRIRLPVDG